ncbi:sensor histidine kinase [Brachybacterium sp. GCM10030267]|uniref:sensor histidine kinase n=1 Tax=unclassified Brachybacterium TaxID=2623841 RepID=UPI00361AE28F
MTNGPDARPDAPARRVRFRDPFRWIIENPGKVDAIVFSAAAFLVLLFAAGSGGIGWWTLFSLPMIVSAAVCRVRPGLGVILIGCLAVMHVPVVPVVLGDVLTFYAMFCAVAYGRPAVHALGMAAGFLGVLVQSGYWGIFLASDPYGDPLQAAGTSAGLFVVGIVTITAIWALANLQRARVRQLALTRERAEQAMREREQRTALAVADERARIAREMHDVVAHSLSVIIAQADGGRFIASQQPEKAGEVLSTIGETGRAALSDMRSLLGVLRQEDETGYGPQPGPEMLQDLTERVRAAGLEVSLEIEGRLDDLPQALGMSLFRLVQEALTNVLKHAGPGASAAVRITRNPQRLQVEIVDDGQGAAAGSDGQGHGLTGMRERVAVFGGVLQAGPLPGHGYRVLATVPLDGAAPSSGTIPSAPARSALSHSSPSRSPQNRSVPPPPGQAPSPNP